MKTEVYSWRLSRDLKIRLEEAAREEGVSLSKLLERIAREWLTARPSATDDEEEQRRLHASAMRFVGILQSGDPDLAEKASERMKQVLRERRARSRAP